MSVRGKMFPSLVETAGDGYKLSIPVPGPENGLPVRSVWIPPPRRVVPGDTDIWPGYCFQLLMVASEYCAALHEFLTWEFDDEWRPLKAGVVALARQFISDSATVLPPSLPRSPDNLRVMNAYSVWATFTYCYFNGIREAPDGQLSEATQAPSKWLRRLVGERGWHVEGPVYTAAAHWVRKTRNRLVELFPDIERMHAYDWQREERGGGERVVASRGEPAEGKMYMPVYPYRLSGGYGGNRVKFTVNRHAAPRSIKGCCGVPHDYGQTNNCAQGFLVLADVMQAFSESNKHWPKDPQMTEEICTSFFSAMFGKGDAVPLCREHIDYGYPAYVASCALGWDLALQHVPLWVDAAAGTAASAWGSDYANGVCHDLLLPRTLSPQACCVWSQQEQRQQQEEQQNLQNRQNQQSQQPLQALVPQQPQQPQPQQVLGYQQLMPEQQQQHHLKHSPVVTTAAGPPALAQQPYQPAYQPPQQLVQTTGPATAFGVDAAAAVVGAAAAASTAGLAPRGPVLAGGLIPGPLSLQASLASAGSAASLGAASGGSSVPAAVSPFVAMQQQQQQQQQLQQLQQLQQQQQQWSSAAAKATAGFSAPGGPGTPPGALPHLASPGGQQLAGPHNTPLYPHPPPLSPQPPPLPPQPSPQPPPQLPNGAAPTEGVTSGLSNMSLDGSFITFADEMLRLIQEEALKPGAGGPSPYGAGRGEGGMEGDETLLPGPEGLAAGTGGFVDAVTAGRGFAPPPLAPPPPPIQVAAGGMVEPSPRTVTTVVSVPQRYPQPPMQTPPAAAAAAAEVAGGGHARAVSHAVGLLESANTVLGQLAAADPDVHARLGRLHREVALALGAFYADAASAGQEGMPGAELAGPAWQHGVLSPPPPSPPPPPGSAALAGLTPADWDRLGPPGAFGCSPVPLSGPPQQQQQQQGGGIFVPSPGAGGASHAGGINGVRSVPGLVPGAFGAAASARPGDPLGHSHGAQQPHQQHQLPQLPQLQHPQGPAPSFTPGADFGLGVGLGYCPKPSDLGLQAAARPTGVAPQGELLAGGGGGGSRVKTEEEQAPAGALGPEATGRTQADGDSDGGFEGAGGGGGFEGAGGGGGTGGGGGSRNSSLGLGAMLTGGEGDASLLGLGGGVSVMSWTRGGSLLLGELGGLGSPMGSGGVGANGGGSGGGRGEPAGDGGGARA